MHALLTCSFAFLILTKACQSQYFPKESDSKVKKEAVCAPPTHLNDTDDFEYSQYTRIPFTSSSHFDEAHKADPEAYGRHKDLLHRIYAHPLFLQKAQIDLSVSSSGQDSRIQRFVTKLVAGEAVKVVVLGGSISYGHGVMNSNNTWPSRLFKYITDTFPHAGHELLNHAIPATTSSYVAPCVKTMVPEGVDLILLEFTLNDMADEMNHKILEFRKTKSIVCQDEMDHPIRRSMERLIRQLMGLPSHPAIIYLHAWAGARGGNFNEGGVEDYYTTMMSYYGVTTLSVRNAMHNLIRESEDLKWRIWRSKTEFHPTCIGARFMADIVIGYLMNQAATAAWLLHARHGRGTFALPPSPATHDSLPPPFFEGNWGNYSTDCIMADRIQSYVNHNVGFEWVNEGLPNDPKWGFVAKTAGSEMAFKIPLDGVVFNGEDLVVGFGLLLSYSNDMGAAQLGCLKGCACILKETSTYIKYSGWSMTYWRFLHAKVLNGSKECYVGVIDSRKTYSQGHKVKVSSLLVSGELGNLDAGNRWLENGLVDDLAPNVHRRRTSEELSHDGHAGVQVDLGGGFIAGSVQHRNDLLKGLTMVDMFPEAGHAEK